MKRFVEGEDRRQGVLLTEFVDDYVSEEMRRLPAEEPVYERKERRIKRWEHEAIRAGHQRPNHRIYGAAYGPQN